MMKELLIKLANALHNFDDSNLLLKEIDTALAEPDPEPIGYVRDYEIELLLKQPKRDGAAIHTANL